MSSFEGTYSTGKVRNEDGSSRKVTVFKTLPDTVEGFVDQYGEQVVLSLISGEVSTRIGSVVRALLIESESDEVIQEAVSNMDFSPRVRTSKKDSEISILRQKSADMDKVASKEMTLEEFSEKWAVE